MNKKIIMSVLFGTLLTASTAMAAPLDDFSKGKTAVDLGFNWSSKIENDTNKWDGKSAMYAGVTTGLGNNIALRYKYDNWQGRENGAKGNVQVHQLAAMYQVAPGISPYLGWAMYKEGVKVGGLDLGNETTNTAHIGIVAQHKFAQNKAKVWGDVAFGTKKTQNYEIGVGYEVAKNWDLNLTWQYNKADDSTYKGFKTGVTYKF